MARTRRSSAFSTASPLGASPSTSSRLADATASIEPRRPTCARPTLSTTPMVGGTVYALRRPFAEYAGGAAFHRLGNEDVSIVLPPAERDKEPARLDLARVGKEPWKRDIRRAAQQPPTCRLDDLLHGHPHSITILAPLSQGRSWRDLPLGDQRAGDRFPDGGRDIGALEEDLRLAGDH